jgi:hypothetical protein
VDRNQYKDAAGGGGMKELPYKDLIIEALPWQSAESRKWVINIRIWKYSGSNIASRHFSASDAFATQDEAIAQCFNFGKQIIDGKILLHSVDDL